jgi:tripartite-type tricarboxylate transporter receptor subunit TctC
MSGVEKNAMAFGYYVDKHVDDERKLNLRAIIDKAAKDPKSSKIFADSLPRPCATPSSATTTSTTLRRARRF